MGEQLKAVPTNNYDEAVMRLRELADDARKFYANGNNAAGTRLRVGLQDVARLVKATRDEVTAIKKTRKDLKNWTA